MSSADKVSGGFERPEPEDRKRDTVDERDDHVHLARSHLVADRAHGDGSGCHQSTAEQAIDPRNIAAADAILLSDTGKKADGGAAGHGEGHAGCVRESLPTEECSFEFAP